MNDNAKALRAKVHAAMYTLIREKGVASPVDVLMAIGALSKADYENWRFGRIDFLQRVCKMNLKKLSFVNKEIRAYARMNNLRPSLTEYKKWGKGVKILLRFSKFGVANIEKHYATHYIRQKEKDHPRQSNEQQRAELD